MTSMGSFGKILEVDAKVEKVAADLDKLETFEFYGQTIRVRDWISPYPMMIFADVVNLNAPIVSVKALSALYSVLTESILEEDWPLFNNLAMRNQSDSDTILAVVSAIYTSWVQRPLEQSSNSSSSAAATGQEPVSSEGLLPPFLESQPEEQKDPSTPEPEEAMSG